MKCFGKMILALAGICLSHAAQADAYFICESPYMGGVSIEPLSKTAAVNHFTLRLTSDSPILSKLGLATTQEYQVRGTFADCQSSPNSSLITYCDSFTGETQVEVTGLFDHSVRQVTLQGISLDSTQDLKTTISGQSNYLNVLLRLYTSDQVVKQNIFFEVPLPGAPEHSPSQCN